ncbi:MULTISPECIES: hypothetical protein [unclassified Microcoleus]|uniref:hypothetical protein n=1 Tax=unclassified Microcoleus TaxID=2642155 RepID=UPI002FD0CA66
MPDGSGKLPIERLSVMFEGPMGIIFEGIRGEWQTGKGFDEFRCFEIQNLNSVQLKSRVCFDRPFCDSGIAQNCPVGRSPLLHFPGQTRIIKKS